LLHESVHGRAERLPRPVPDRQVAECPEDCMKEEAMEPCAARRPFHL
jgi:hypothetical protein